MLSQCEQLKDELVTLIYPDEPKSPVLESHLKSCTSCQQDLKSLSFVAEVYEKLPEVYPPSHLTEKILAQISSRPSFLEKIKVFFRHPATVGLTVFCFTLAGTLLYQRYVSSPTQIAQKEPSSSTPSTSVATVSNFQPFANQAGFRMVGWQSPVRLLEDLDRPVLRHTDVLSLEHASIEAVASFKHQLAMRHIVDGEYEKAHMVLDNIADNYLNYSHWEQAVLQHMRLAKRMGRGDEVQKDLNRLREYAMATPELVRQAEMEAVD